MNIYLISASNEELSSAVVIANNVEQSIKLVRDKSDDFENDLVVRNIGIAHSDQKSEIV